MKRAVFLSLVIVLCSLARPLSSGTEQEFENALDRCRRDGGFVLLAIVDRESAQDVREALAEPGHLGELTRYRHVVANADRSPTLRVRFGARQMPLFVLLDGRSNELARHAGARTPSRIVKALSDLGESAMDTGACRARLRSDPEDHEARFHIANHHWQRQEFFRAIDHYGKLLDAPPGATRAGRDMVEKARERVGRYLVEKNRFREAHQLLARVDVTRASARHGDWATLHLALVLRREDRPDAAIVVLTKRLTSSPYGPLADRLLFTLAQLEQETNRKLDALEHYSELEERFPRGRYGRRAKRILSESAAFTPTAG